MFLKKIWDSFGLFKQREKEKKGEKKPAQGIVSDFLIKEDTPELIAYRERRKRLARISNRSRRINRLIVG